MITLTQRLPADPSAIAPLTLALTAEERTRSRHRFETSDGQAVYLHLPRGTVLRDGDLLQAEIDEHHPDRQPPLVRIIAKPEPVLTVTTTDPLDLLRAAYHLGNRHIPLEISTTYLRFLPDPVLQSMLEHLGLQVIPEELPFEPELGAYGHQHAH
ncbi:MAG: urease accessory protein UreE [Leptolyngbyaceae bacterium]|nr:urease accessory protein UreE [Leptolyngbyaceae bacterium]